jgi:hypothetical protein
MPRFAGIDRAPPSAKGVEPDTEGWPVGHYRGKGYDQSRTGPADQWLDEEAARFIRPPAREKKPRPRRAWRPGGEIAEEICAAFAVHTDLEDACIDVEVRKTEVHLRGVVRSTLAELRALELAAAARGVTAVANGLRVVRRLPRRRGGR